MRPPFFETARGKALVATAAVGGLATGAAIAGAGIASARRSGESARAAQQGAGRNITLAAPNGTTIATGPP